MAERICVSENTVRSWISTLRTLHYGFLLRPWHKNIGKSLRKEPKWYLRDWSTIADEGKRAETFCACHLLKAVNGWTDLGFGTFDLHYVRDKERRKVDFLVVRDGSPWFLAEAKLASSALSPNLGFFQNQIKCPNAFQITIRSEFVDRDCFSYDKPIVVPAKTFFSQLL